MKYRFWDTENNCWYRPVYNAEKGQLEEILITQSGEICLRKLEGTEFKFTSENLFPGRFIENFNSSVKDKEGKKIYVDDIVQVSYGFGKVVLNHGCFMIEWIDDKEAFMEMLGFDKHFRSRKDLEVIGNIYEYPELLKTK